MKFYKKGGFSLAEALIFLLVACLILLASMPVITRRHIIPPERVPHGKWACKLINGVKHQATAAHSNADLPPDDEWTEGCDFPTLPGAVKYVIVRVIGAGANGGIGNVSVDPTNDEKILFPTFESKYNTDAQSAAYYVEETGTYTIRIYGDRGKDGTLSPSYVDVKYPNASYNHRCNFQTANARDTVPYVEFDYDLMRGDALTMQRDCSDNENKLNGQPEQLCDHTVVHDLVYADDTGLEHHLDYKFAYVRHYPGKNGCKKTLYRSFGTNKVPLVTIDGGGGGYYYSNSDACTLNCEKRYEPSADKETMYADDPIKTVSYLDSNINPDSVKPGWGPIESKSQMYINGFAFKIHGGCGGAAGQTDTLLMLKPKEGQNYIIQPGDATSTDPIERSTRFNIIEVKGANKDQCSSQGVGYHAQGQEGESAADYDSIGGAGGYGTVRKSDLQAALPESIYTLIGVGITDEVKTTIRNALIEQVGISGKPGQGIGAGGGGGGVVFAIDSTQENDQLAILEFMKSLDAFSHEDITFVGDGGEGTSGGIVVAW